MTHLPNQVVALIHQTELHRSGWWDEAIDRFILAVLWMSSEPLSAQTVTDTISSEVGVQLDATTVQEALDGLVQQRWASLRHERFYLTATKRQELDVEVQGMEERALAAAARLASLVDQDWPQLRTIVTWDSFNENLLLPLVSELGADVYRIITNSAHASALDEALNDFLNRYPAEYRSGLRTLTISFLDPHDSVTRNYVLQQLAASFTVRAAGLDTITLKSLSEAAHHRTTFTLFLDTNFVFSLLGLHDNPANEAAESVAMLAQAISPHVDVKFRVLPPTLAEAKQALIRAEERCSKLVLTRNVARGISNVTFRGAVQGFVEQARRPDGIRDPKRYFEPYIDSLPTILRDNGVDIFVDESLDRLATSQPIIDDILQQEAFEKRRAHGGKSYEQVKHDVVLWHFTRRRRVPGHDSALTVQYWVVTVDFRFLGFDGYKLKHQREPPVCIHPAALLQLLRFWVPRSETVDQALLSALRLPLLFKPFDRSTEQAVLQILETLSRFESLDRLSPEAIQEIVQSGQLQDRISNTQGVAEQTELVREELVAMEASLRRRAETAESEAVAKDEAAKELQARVEQLDAQVGELGVVLEKRGRTADTVKRRADAASSELASERSLAARGYERMVVAIGILALGLIYLGLWAEIGQPWWVSLLSGSVLSLSVVMELALRSRHGNEHSRWFYKLGLIRERVAAAIWLVVVGVLGNVVYSVLQPHLPDWLKSG